MTTVALILDFVDFPLIIISFFRLGVVRTANSWRFDPVRNRGTLDFRLLFWEKLNFFHHTPMNEIRMFYSLLFGR